MRADGREGFSGVGLNLYVSAYAVDGSVGNQTAFIFFALCIIGNIINVVMEEGMFRGLFQKIFEKKYSLVIAAVIASALFGLWHIMSPLRSYCDGTMSTGGLCRKFGYVDYNFCSRRFQVRNDDKTNRKFVYGNGRSLCE